MKYIFQFVDLFDRLEALGLAGAAGTVAGRAYIGADAFIREVRTSRVT